MNDHDDLNQSLIVEIAAALGYRNSPFVQKMARFFFSPITNRLTDLGIAFEKDIRQAGFSQATKNLSRNFIKEINFKGKDALPPSGPLVVLSNHPGTVDTLVIPSVLQRDDLRIIARDIPFLVKLPELHNNFLFISRESFNNMVAARKAIRHLRNEGAMLVYGYGYLEPDPAVYEDAEGYLNNWYNSIDVFLKAVPETRVVLSIVSHVVSASWRNSILYYLRRKPLDRRLLVEFGQVISQLFFPGKLLLTPFVSFSKPYTYQELESVGNGEGAFHGAISLVKAQFADHMNWTIKAGVSCPRSGVGYFL